MPVACAAAERNNPARAMGNERVMGFSTSTQDWPILMSGAANAKRARPGSIQGNAPAGRDGRGERIRTSGLYVPNVALYQAKLHPEAETGAVAPVGFPAD